MKRVFFDQNIPGDLRQYCSAHQVTTVKDAGWDQLVNGELLRAIEGAGFEVFITADKNLQFQQNLKARKFAVVVLGTNDWETIEKNPGLVADAIEAAEPGSFTVVDYKLPPKRPRRPWPSSG